MTDVEEEVEVDATDPKPEISAEVMALKGKLAQVQEKNKSDAAARSELAAKLKAFEGIDPDSIAKMREAYEQSQTSEERAESARKQMEDNAKRQREEFDQERKAWTDTQTKERSRLEGAVMKDRVLAELEAKKLQLEPGARESLLLHAERTFAVSDDMQELKPREVMLDNDNNEMTVDKWLDKVVGTHSYLFKGGKGGGARPGSPGGGAKTQYVMKDLTPAQRSNAVEEIKAGTAEWK